MIRTSVEPGLERRGGVLHLDGTDLAAVATRHATPCYVYSAARISAAYREYANALGTRGRVYYAVKANPSRAILQILARLGAGFDIVSGGEMQRVLAAGGAAEAMVFSGVGKTDTELRAALSAGVGRFNVESHSELHRLGAIAAGMGKKATVALRVNPDVSAATHRHIATGSGHHKFGIAQRAAAALAHECLALPGIVLDGLAMHIGSQIVDPDPVLAATRRLVTLAEELRRDGVAVGHLDLGGGLGIGAGAPRIGDYVQLLSSAVGTGWDIGLEPGRSIVAEAGVLLTRVTCIKHQARRSFAVVDAGMNDFLRPALYDAWHDIAVVDDRRAPPAGIYDVVGPVCESADTLGTSRRLAVREGSLLAILDTGAYGATMRSHYNSRPFCPEVIVADGEARLASPRQSVGELIGNENDAPGSTL